MNMFQVRRDPMMTPEERERRIEVLSRKILGEVAELTRRYKVHNQQDTSSLPEPAGVYVRETRLGRRR